MLPKSSLTTFVYINLAIGLLAAAANGGALFLTLTGRGGALGGQAPEMAAWFATGLLLLAMSGYALLRADSALKVLQIQTGVVFLLVLGLSLWALATILSGPVAQSRVFWSVGYLSLLAFYSVIIALRVFDNSKPFSWRAVAWGFFAACVLIDVSMFVKLSDF